MPSECSCKCVSSDQTGDGLKWSRNLISGSQFFKLWVTTQKLCAPCKIHLISLRIYRLNMLFWLINCFRSWVYVASYFLHYRMESIPITSGTLFRTSLLVSHLLHYLFLSWTFSSTRMQRWKKAQQLLSDWIFSPEIYAEVYILTRLVTCPILGLVTLTLNCIFVSKHSSATLHCISDKSSRVTWR